MEMLKSFKLEHFVRRRAGHVMVSYKNKLFLWGGYMEEPHEVPYTLTTPSASHFHDPKEIWIYETLLNIWHRKICTGDVPVELSGASAGVIGNFMYLFGGYLGNEPSFEGSINPFWRLNLDTYEWKQMSPNGFHPFPCDKSASWVYNNRFYIFGGYGRVIPPDRVPPVPVEFEIESGMHYKGWIGQLVYYDTDRDEWVWPKVKGVRPTPRAAHAAAVIKNKAFVFGGRHKDRRLNDLYRFNLENHEWTEIHCAEGNPLPLGRSWHTLNAVSEDKLVIYGGFSTECKVLYDAWVFDTSTNIWSPLPSTTYSRRLWHRGASIKSAEVIYVGGISTNILDYKPKEHAEDMLRIRFSPPSLFELVLEYVSSSRHVMKQAWSQLTPVLQKILQVRTDPFEIHGL